MKLPFFQIAYMYPPINTVGVLRNQAITDMLVEQGHRGTVVTSKHTPVRATQRTEVDIIHVSVLDYRSRRGKTANFHPSQTSKNSLAYSVFSKFKNSYPFYLVLGEGAFLFIYKSYKVLDKLIEQAGGKGIIVSSFRPWADHQVAYLLKKKYPKLIWWCDWRDTAFENRKKKPVAIRYQQKKLKQLLSNADIVTTVSAGVMHDLQPIRCEHKVLFNGATNSVSDLPVPDQITMIPSISYTGSLYGKDRDPTPLFKALSEICGTSSAENPPFSLIYAGKDEQGWNSLLRSVDPAIPSRSLGLISQQEALAVQKKAAVNLLLTWSNPGQTGGLTMKIFEYLRSGQPILRIHDGPSDPEIDEVLAKAEAPVFTLKTTDLDFTSVTAWLRTQLINYRVNPIVSGFELSEGLAEFYNTSLSHKLK